MKWQPIETAPKDGTTILIAYKSVVTGNWRYDLASWKEDPHTNLHCLCSEQGNDWSVGSYYTPYSDAAYWMPLSSPELDTTAIAHLGDRLNVLREG